MDLVCDDGKVCTLSYEFLATCVIYIKDAEHPHCEVPCHMEHCKEERHFYINCPIYFCTLPPAPPSTTTSAPPTTTTPQPGPSPLPPDGPSHSGYATSVTFNVIMGAILAVIGGRKFLKKRTGRIENPIIRQSQGIVNPLYQDTEREPLLARINFRRNQRPRTEDIAMHGLDAAEARFIEARETINEPETLSDFAELDLEAGSSAPPFPSRSFAQKVRSLFVKTD